MFWFAIWKAKFFFSDVDECTASSLVCDVNANCNNTQGSYHCSCKPGFTGDGITCQGENDNYITVAEFYYEGWVLLHLSDRNHRI